MFRYKFKQIPSFHLAVISIIGITAFYVFLFTNFMGSPDGGPDWVVAFRNSAHRDYSGIVTPYWVIFLSLLPAYLPNPWGYAMWIGCGGLLLLLVARYFKANWWVLLISYQLHWCMFYGQVDFYVITGISIGFGAFLCSNSWLIGLGILLALIKPQVGLLASIYLFFISPNKKISAFVILTVTLLSLLLWPGWPLSLIIKYSNFMSDPANIGTNTSLGLPLWLGLSLSAIGLLLPLDPEKKIPTLVALNLLIFPYSTIYSQLALFCFPLHPLLSFFAIVPWFIAWILGPFGHWQLGWIFPICVLFYFCLPLLKNVGPKIK